MLHKDRNIKIHLPKNLHPANRKILFKLYKDEFISCISFETKLSRSESYKNDCHQRKIDTDQYHPSVLK